MRRLHPVAHREQMVAQGEYVYLRDGRPTGTVEVRELTRLPDGSRIYRAEVGDGVGLWHLMLAPDGRPDRLQARLRDEVGRRFDATLCDPVAGSQSLNSFPLSWRSYV